MPLSRQSYQSANGHVRSTAVRARKKDLPRERVLYDASGHYGGMEETLRLIDTLVELQQSAGQQKQVATRGTPRVNMVVHRTPTPAQSDHYYLDVRLRH